MTRPAVLQRAIRFALMLGLVIFGVVSLRGCERHRIPAQDQSMDPTYPGGATVFAWALAPEAPLDRGTDVVYEMEKDGATYARFGRVQAIPGDEVGAADGKLTVNGTPIGPIPVPGEAMGRVLEGRVLILAINPAEKQYPDSRTLGFIPRERVRAVIRTSIR
jgi:hypothetical protein